jgi:hypothetical protein
VHYQQHVEARHRKQIADVQSLMRHHGFPLDELFAAWYVDEDRKDSLADAYEAYCTPIDGVSPKDREERKSRIKQVTYRAHAVMITDPWAANFAAWYVDEDRIDPLLSAWDEWRTARFARGAA